MSWTWKIIVIGTKPITQEGNANLSLIQNKKQERGLENVCVWNFNLEQENGLKCVCVCFFLKIHFGTGKGFRETL